MNWPVWAHIAAGFCLGARLSSAEPLVWSQGKGFRSAEVRPVPGGRPGFTLMPPERTGITFANELRGDAYLTNSVAHNGSGLALGDVDGDGWVDIYLCNLQGPNRLYRNLGNWRFEEMEIGPAACAGQFSTGAAFADVDGDGDLDLLVNGIAAGTRLFLNDGKGHWTEKLDSGLSRTNSATSLALADIDGDGDLDLYCTHYIDVMYLFDPTTRFALARRGNQWMVTKVNGQPATLPKWTNRFEALPDGRVRELPEAHAIYRNDGHGHFTAIQNSGTFSDEQGKPIAAYRDWGLSVMFRDLNGDGAPDIYVCNDNASPDRIWINTGHGTFRPASREMFRHFSRSAMGIDIADVNRDGYDDIIVLDMLAREHGQRMKQLVKDYPDRALKEHIDERPEYNRNSLFLGRPDGTYAETALMAGLAATDWSWCPIFVDVDLDGFEDLLVTNGFEFDVLDQDSHDELHHPKERLSDAQLHRFFQFYPHWRTQNAAFRNRGDGTFEPMNEKWGFDKSGVSYGMALADLDNDGDLDVVVNNLNDTASIYRNDTTGGRVQVRLKGSGSNTQGIGARIRLTGGAVTQSQEMICGGRYLSG
ncbi:MAG TPA: VCBS repeat-containing protein, partial [Verrucomicrobiae bacterium]|nr:VCBS repeat-containing protein [Verrucomicrobiae bacterium]